MSGCRVGSGATKSLPAGNGACVRKQDKRQMFATQLSQIDNPPEIDPVDVVEEDVTDEPAARHPGERTGPNSPSAVEAISRVAD